MTDSKTQSFRALNKDGTDNINRSGLKYNWRDAYHLLLSMSWTRFFANTLGIYFSINLMFSLIYYTIGPDGFNGLLDRVGAKFYEECFFFSIQTFSTIGYGRVSPLSLPANIAVSIEAFFGMLSVAVMSGLLFARFSRPTAKIRFSQKALITDHRGQKSFIFRLANARLNQIAEATLSVTVLVNYIDQHGRLRLQHDLPLVRSRSLMFSASWTAVHVIDEKSPFFNKSIDDLRELDAEIIVSVIGHDGTFGDTIHARYSYMWNEIELNRQFVDILIRENGRIHVDIERISELKPIGTLAQ